MRKIGLRGLGFSRRKAGPYVPPTPPTLNALTLSSSQVIENSPPGTVIGTFLGTTSLSALVLTDNAGGRLVIAGSHPNFQLLTGLVNIDYDPGTGGASTLNWAASETRADATNSPRASNGTITVVDQDEVPSAFVFTDVTGGTVSTQYTSNAITVAGLGSGVSSPVSITGGTYSKNGGGYTSAAGTAVNGDTFAVRLTSSASNETAVNGTLTIGGVSDTFTVTTEAAGEGTYDPDLVITSFAAQDADYPPVFVAVIEGGTEDGDQLEMPAATSYANLLAGTYLNIGSTIQTITGSPLDFGLSAITSPAETYAKIRLRRGGDYGPWYYAAHGDLTAPTITSSATGTPQMEGPAGTITGIVGASEFVIWSIAGGSHADMFDIDPETGTWETISPTVFEDGDLQVIWRATDLAGNETDQLFTQPITDRDTMPDAFNYVNVTNAVADGGVQTASTTWTVAGLGSGISVPVTFVSGQYRKNGGAWTNAATPSTAVNGDTFERRGNRSGVDAGSVSFVTKVGDYETTWLVTNAAGSAAAAVVQWTGRQTGVTGATRTFEAIEVDAGIQTILIAVSSDQLLSGVTFGGVAATKIVEANRNTSMWQIATGAVTGDLAVTIGVGWITDIDVTIVTRINTASAASDTATKSFAFGGDPQVTSTGLDRASDGLAIAIVGSPYGFDPTNAWVSGSMLAAAGDHRVGLITAMSEPVAFNVNSGGTPPTTICAASWAKEV